MHLFRKNLRHGSFSVWLLLSVGSFGCGHDRSAQRPASPPAAVQPSAAAPTRLPMEVPPAPQNGSIADLMGEHFTIVSWARNAVIAGELDALREPLAALAAYRYEEVPAGRRLPWVAQLQQAARLTSEAAKLEVAASGVATMARVCGECHLANHAGPSFPAVANPLERVAADGVDARMARHLWAAELLWEGITGPSDVTWYAGAKTLLEAPDALDERLPEGFDDALLQVRRLGQKAQDAQTLAARADLYGVLLTTCADCHTRWLARTRNHDDEP